MARMSWSAGQRGEGEPRQPPVFLPTARTHVRMHVRCWTADTSAAVATLRDHALPIGRQRICWEKT